MTDPPELVEADKLGAIRQRREDTLARAYNLSTINRARLLEIAIFDALGLADSEARAAILTRLASQLPDTFDSMLPIERELARIVAGVRPLLVAPDSNK